VTILHVADYLPGYHEKWGGAELACWRLFCLLKKQGLEINIATIKPIKKPQENYNFFFLQTVENLMPRALRPFYSRITSIIPVDFLVLIQFYRLILKVKPKLIHLHNFKHLSFAVIWAAKLLKVPMVLSIYDYWYFCPNETLMHSRGEVCVEFHGVGCLDCFGIPAFFGYQLKFRRRLFNFFLNKINAFIVLSQSSREILQQYGIDPAKIKIVYLPAPSQAESEAEHNKEIKHPCLLFVGAVSSNKGADIAVEALAYIKKELPKVSLYVVGALKEESDPRYFQKIEDILQREGLGTSVIFLGRLKPELTRSALSESEAVIIPEQWPNMSPVVLMEAMALAKPIVASKIGAIAEFIQDGKNGLLAEPKKPQQFAKHFVRVFNNAEWASELGRQARQDAAKIWNDDLNLQRTLQLYESLLQS